MTLTCENFTSKVEVLTHSENNNNNNNNNKFLYSAFHNNRINALYASALVMGPITSP